jgi:hypothetical protein
MELIIQQSLRVWSQCSWGKNSFSPKAFFSQILPQTFPEESRKGENDFMSNLLNELCLKTTTKSKQWKTSINFLQTICILQIDTLIMSFTKPHQKKRAFGLENHLTVTVCNYCPEQRNSTTTQHMLTNLGFPNKRTKQQQKYRTRSNYLNILIARTASLSNLFPS